MTNALSRLLVLTAVAFALGLGAASVASAADPDAPAGAPATWLPDERWVAERWLPYDQTLLAAKLRIAPADLTQYIGDDLPLAREVRRRGRTVRSLARELVAGWARSASPRRRRELERRATRTLTQPHLMVHMLTHAWHLASVNGDLLPMLGLTSWERYGALRGQGLSLAQMGARNGRTYGQLRRRTISVVTAAAHRGARRRETPRPQALCVLKVQTDNVDSWLTAR